MGSHILIHFTSRIGVLFKFYLISKQDDVKGERAAEPKLQKMLSELEAGLQSHCFKRESAASLRGSKAPHLDEHSFSGILSFLLFSPNSVSLLPAV